MADTGNVINCFSTSVGDGLNPAIAQGRGGELLVAEVHGPAFHAAMRGALFGFNVTAVTIPVTSSNVVSVFSLYNPVGSNRYLELVDIDISAVLVTTVVNTLGLYTQTPQLIGKGTFTTAGTVQNMLLNGQGSGVGVAYTAFTFSGTQTRWQIVGYNGAATTLSNQVSHYEFKGKAVIPPGSLVALLNSTTVGTTTANDVNMTWIETAF